MVTEEHDGKVSLRILMDKFTLEVFANDGEQAMTSLIYTPLCARDIRFPAMERLKFLWLCMNWYRGFNDRQVFLIYLS